MKRLMAAESRMLKCVFFIQRQPNYFKAVWCCFCEEQGSSTRLSLSRLLRTINSCFTISFSGLCCLSVRWHDACCSGCLEHCLLGVFIPQTCADIHGPQRTKGNDKDLSESHWFMTLITGDISGCKDDLGLTPGSDRFFLCGVSMFHVKIFSSSSGFYPYSSKTCRIRSTRGSEMPLGMSVHVLWWIGKLFMVYSLSLAYVS